MRTEKYIDKVSEKELIKYIYYYIDSNEMEIEIYFLNKLPHRSDGPAIIWYNRNENIIKKQYYMNGIQCDILQEMVIQGLETR